ncbi:ThiF family adenylyltransferase [Halobacillus salinarum]|uniref:ThiF family adenylyltransferase n=1 Tax=Halobacillus salinarum TaxID=2932257 RepID=A0ABY4EL71_9BACI|nr:ThiF family adenylyltransferase [Halobacillus salinarum]UOQ42836.1 ThiF family adenylyltransferase [Halobacillus salinarum]
MTVERYSRQERFHPIGKAGQSLLARSHVLIIGGGALGSANAEMLTRAGVGRLTIIDRDYVEWSNLGRQQLYTETDVQGFLPKAKAAEKKLQKINSTLSILGVAEEFSSENAERWLQDVDIIIDGTDNFETRFILNDAAAKQEIPWIYGGCVKSHGLCLPILPGKTPCLQCLINQIPQDGETCDTAGIIAPAVQMVAAHQTTNCLKFLTGNQMSKKLFFFDIWNEEHSFMDVSSLLDFRCPTCSEHATYPYLTKRKGVRTAVLCGRDTVQIRPEEKNSISLSVLYQRLEPVTDKLIHNGELLMFYAENTRFVVFKDGRTLIHGTNDIKQAKKLYQQFIGA